MLQRASSLALLADGFAISRSHGMQLKVFLSSGNII